MQDDDCLSATGALPVSPASTAWRLIPLLDAPGRIQMALDTWLLEQHRLGKHPPTLRFYTWSPAAISLGYHQYSVPDSWQHLTWQAQAIDWVHRPTGGRAVLHQGDLTYTLITSGLQGSRLQIYRQLCTFLIQGWQKLGVRLHYGQAGRGYIHNPNCFGTATGADLLLEDGCKLIGSAQLYRGQAILQHGSMRLATDAELFAQVFGESLPPLNWSSQVKASLFSQTMESSIVQIIEGLVEAACECFEVSIVLQPLSQSEWQAVMAVAEESTRMQAGQLSRLGSGFKRLGDRR
ncbi:MAG: lipoate--protein ligase family protein [Scytolyngbya sp. HA4215-MV1]|jgi:lipoate-protein ligase A|nr:lipoate--protein ligase family protein [Scytolyngbya sp. HA4215-MV1]